MRGWALLVLLVGCDDVFDLEHVTPIDAPAGVDYDRDGVFAEDNCPFVANADQLDEDSDQVGNACDPHPGEHDAVVYQTWFTSTTSEWVPLGDWTRGDDGWTSPDATLGGTMSLPARNVFRPALQAGFRIVAYDPQMMLRQLEVHLDAPANADCSVRADPNSTSTSQLVTHLSNAPYVSTQIVPDYTFATPYVVTYTRALMDTCTIAGQGVTRNDDTAERFTTAPTLTLVRMQATIDHVTLYEVLQ